MFAIVTAGGDKSARTTVSLSDAWEWNEAVSLGLSWNKQVIWKLKTVLINKPANKIKLTIEKHLQIITLAGKGEHGGSSYVSFFAWLNEQQVLQYKLAD